MKNNLIRFNNMDFEFDVTLRNSGGEIVLPRELFRELKFTETFLDWNSKGYLIYDNADERLERYKKGGGKCKNKEHFYFRMDGTDTIELWLKPVEKYHGKLLTLNGFNTDKMFIKFKGIIYDSEDISDANMKEKQKKLYFWNEVHQKAIALNTRVSCGDYKVNVLGETETADYNNIDRRVLVGELMEYILTEKLGVEIDPKQWDYGTRSTFYVSPPSSTVRDDMNALLNIFVSDDMFPGWFHYDRFEEKFALISYKTLFDRYDTEDRERFSFPDNSKLLFKVRPPRFKDHKSFNMAAVSDVLAYKYSKMSGMDNTKMILSRSVTSYDSMEKIFKVDAETGNIEVAKEAYSELLSKFPPRLDNTIFTINQDKINNKLIEETQTVEPSNVLINTIKAGVLFNDAITIRALGLVSRTAGQFIDMSAETDTEGIWEDKFLGAWLTLEVEHRVTTSKYTNKILAIKPSMATAFTYPDDAEILGGLS